MKRFVLLASLAILAPACTPDPPVITTPPVFGGITGGSSTASGTASLTWNPATDFSNTGIVYLVAWSLIQGGEVQGSSDSGVTSNGHGILVSGLTSTDTYWFVVQAMDGNGVMDANSPPPEFAIKIQ